MTTNFRHPSAVAMLALAGWAALLVAAPPAAAQESRVYRCGNEYTNNAAEAKQRGCKPLEGGNITIVQGTRPAGDARPPGGPVVTAPRSGGSGGDSGNNSSEQRARDADARAILENELRRAQARQAELQKEYNNGEPEKLGPETRNYQKYLDRVEELKAGIARNDSDIAGIQRELSRLSSR
jgi:hypothetical protein